MGLELEKALSKKLEFCGKFIKVAELFLEGSEQVCGLNAISHFCDETYWQMDPVSPIIRQIGDYIKISSLIFSWAYLWSFHGLVFQRRSPT